MLDFIFNKLFIKRALEEKTVNPLKNTYIRKQRDTDILPACKRRFVLTEKKYDKTELSSYFNGLKGLNLKGRVDNITCSEPLKVK